MEVLCIKQVYLKNIVISHRATKIWLSSDGSLSVFCIPKKLHSGKIERIGGKEQYQGLICVGHSRYSQPG